MCVLIDSPYGDSKVADDRYGHQRAEGRTTPPGRSFNHESKSSKNQLWRKSTRASPRRIVKERIQLTCSGVWDGLSSQEAMETYPDEWERFLADPYAHRAPRAESYHDLSGMSPLSLWLFLIFLSYPHGTRPLITVRLEPIIFELERVQEDMLVIGHASVIRCLVRLPPPFISRLSFSLAAFHKVRKGMLISARVPCWITS